MKGWIKLHRSICDNKLWFEEPFTRAQAWIDLLILANHEQMTLYKRGIRVVVNRGEVGWAERELSERWRWSRGKLRRYLKTLEMEQQIVQQKNHTLSRIIIKNYSKYQENSTTDSTTDSTNNKNDKNDKEITMGGFNNYSDDYLEGELQIDPDHAPKAKKKPTKVSGDVQAVFDLFDNPARALWVLREVERVAAKTLFDTYGIEKLKIRLERITKEKKKADPFFPHADTPSQLLDKMPNIERYFNI